jgi:predicted nucleic acid-binding protein
VFVRDGLWPPVVPSVVLAESITGRQRNDANVNRLLKTCDVVEHLPEPLARRAGELRFKARRGSAVDAILVASAEPSGAVLTGDDQDLRALANHADRVTIQRV